MTKSVVVTQPKAEPAATNSSKRDSTLRGYQVSGGSAPHKPGTVKPDLQMFGYSDHTSDGVVQFLTCN